MTGVQTCQDSVAWSVYTKCWCTVCLKYKFYKWSWIINKRNTLSKMVFVDCARLLPNVVAVIWEQSEQSRKNNNNNTSWKDHHRKLKRIDECEEPIPYVSICIHGVLLTGRNGNHAIVGNKLKACCCYQWTDRLTRVVNNDSSSLMFD